MKKVYQVVAGNYGEDPWEPDDIWIVETYSDLIEAKEHLKAAEIWMKKNYHMNWKTKIFSPYDPSWNGYCIPNYSIEEFTVKDKFYE